MSAGLAQGQIIDRYEVEDVIGRGGFATVYRVRHVHLRTSHALKVLQLPHADEQARLIREGRTQAALRHPNVVPVTDVVQVGSSLGLVMDLVRGPDLGAWIQAHEPSLAELDALAEGIFAGVAAAHALGVVHRDLKPSNVLLDVRGDRLVPRIADFGLVTPHPALGTTTRTQGLVGTLAYAAPEQVGGSGRVDHRADIFSLGALLYELATRERAFPAPSLLAVLRMASEETYVPPADLRPELPDRMVRTLVGALRADPEARWADVDAMRAAWFADAPPDGEAPAWTSASMALARALVPAAAGHSSGRPSLPPPRSGSSLPAAGVVGASLVAAALIIVLGPRWLAPGPPAPGPEAPPAAVVEASQPPAPPPESTVPLVAPAPTLAPRAVEGTKPTRAPAATPPPPPSDPPAASPVVDPPPPPTTVVRVDGDVAEISLLDAAGRTWSAGVIPPGTYVVRARFPGETSPDTVLRLVVEEGQTVSLRCTSALRRCSVVR